MRNTFELEVRVLKGRRASRVPALREPSGRFNEEAAIFGWYRGMFPSRDCDVQFRDFLLFALHP